MVAVGLIAGSAGAVKHPSKAKARAAAAKTTKLRLTPSNDAARRVHAPRPRQGDGEVHDRPGRLRPVHRPRPRPAAEHRLHGVPARDRRGAVRRRRVHRRHHVRQARHRAQRVPADRRRGVLEHDRQRQARARRPQPGRDVVRRPRRRRLLLGSPGRQRRSRRSTATTKPACRPSTRPTRTRCPPPSGHGPAAALGAPASSAAGAAGALGHERRRRHGTCRANTTTAPTARALRGMGRRSSRPRPT